MKNLQAYKKELKSRISILIILGILALLAVLVGNFLLKNLFPSKANITDYVVGFFTGLEIVSFFYLIMLVRTYKDETLLKKMYIKETDEREILTRMKSGANIIPLLSMLIVSSSFIVAYISYEAFVAMMLVAFVQIIISKTLKIYWSKKYIKINKFSLKI